MNPPEMTEADQIKTVCIMFVMKNSSTYLNISTLLFYLIRFNLILLVYCDKSDRFLLNFIFLLYLRIFILVSKIINLSFMYVYLLFHSSSKTSLYSTTNSRRCASMTVYTILLQEHYDLRK